MSLAENLKDQEDAVKILAKTMGMASEDDEDQKEPSKVAKFEFDGKFQSKIAALSLRSTQFARRTEGLIQPNYFENEAHSFLVDTANKYFEQYRSVPDSHSVFIHFLKTRMDISKIRSDFRKTIFEEYKVLAREKLTDLNYIAEQVGSFARHQAVQNAMLESINFLEKGDVDSISRIMTKALRTSASDDFVEIDYWNDIERRTQYRKDVEAGIIERRGISTGIKRLDKLLYHLGWGRKELTCLMGGAKKGKCVTRDTILLTEDGMIDIGDYVPPNLATNQFFPFEVNLLGREGMEPTSHIYNNGYSETLKIKTNKGYQIEGTHNHPMLILDEKGDLVWKNLSEVKNGDHMAVQRGQRVFGKAISLDYACDVENNRTKSIKFPKFMSVELAEFLGLIVAEAYFGEDGFLNFTQKDKLIVDRYCFLCKHLFDLETHIIVDKDGCSSVRIQRVTLQRYLKNIGVKWSLSKDKVIPHSIRRAPEPQFRAFLSALIGTECHVRKWSHGKVEVDLCMASEKLIKEIQVALTNFGIVSNRTKKISCATNGSKIKRDYWRLKISGRSNLTILKEIGVYEDRKQKLLESVIDDPSTERNWIPNAREKMCLAMEEFKQQGGMFKKDLGESLARSLRTIRGGRRNEVRHLTYSLAEKFVEILNDLSVVGEGSNWLRDMLRLNYAFEPITSIESSYAETVDFTVPKTHSFFANGLISHNSTGLGHFSVLTSLGGYNTLYVTLEVAGDIISERNDANNSKVPMQELNARADEVANQVLLKGKSKRGHLKIVEMPSGSLSPAGLRRIIERYKSEGIQFDCIIVDYADIMRPDVYTSSEIENSKQIWLGLRAIAYEEDAAVLTATQTNREGFKNDTAKAENVAEDFNKIRIADLVISINRSDEERDRGEARLYFAASRNQGGEFTVGIKQNLETMEFITGVTGVS